MLGTGDYNGFLQGCIGTMTAIRHARKLLVNKEVVFPATVVDMANYQTMNVPIEQCSCLKWEDVVNKSAAA